MVKRLHDKSALPLGLPRYAIMVYGNLCINHEIKKKIENKIEIFFRCCPENIDYDLYLGDVGLTNFSGPMNYVNLEIKARMISKSISEVVSDFISQNKKNEYKAVFLLSLEWLESLTETKACQVFDSSLPHDFLYMEFSKNIDVSYSLNWVWGSPSLMCALAQFEAFVQKEFERLKASQSTLIFNEWPGGIKGTFGNLCFKRILLQTLAITNNGLLQKMISHAGSLCKAKFSGIRSRIIRELHRREGIMEIHSYPIDQRYLPPLHGVASIGVIFKYYVYSMGMREKLRFLQCGDFYVLNNSNKQDAALIDTEIS